MRNYRIVRIADLQCTAPMVALYKNNPGLELQPYAKQEQVLFQNMYVYADSFSKAMKALGHDAYEIVYDLEILQKAWAKEKGVKYNPKRWQTDIILKQIEDIRPDIIYFQDIYSLPLSVRKRLKSLFPFIKLIVIMRGAPGGVPSVLKKEFADADLLIVGSPALVEKLNKVSLNPYLVYHAFDENILEKLETNIVGEHKSKYNFTFVGSSGFGYGSTHQYRYWTLIELLKNTNLELWINEPDLKKQRLIGIRKDFIALTRYFIGELLRKVFDKFDSENINKLMMFDPTPDKVKNLLYEIIEKRNSDIGRIPEKPISEIFPDRYRPPVFGLEMYRVLKESKITFNIHSKGGLGMVDNMRLFEATGVGTCLLTDTGRNMSDLFESDSEVVTYTNIDECIEKVNYLLDHDDVRQQISIAGQKRTLKDHTILNRCRQIDDIIQKKL